MHIAQKQTKIYGSFCAYCTNLCEYCTISMIRFVHIVHISQKIYNDPQFSPIIPYYLCAYCTYTDPGIDDILISSKRKRGKDKW